MSAPARVVRLANDSGLAIELMDRGATWLSCRVPLPDGTAREVLLGCATPDDYARQTAYLGATIGRWANRIGGARFMLDGTEHRLVANEGANQLHGGPGGFDRCVWSLAAVGPRDALLTLASPDGDQGFPGHLDASVRFALDAEALAITITFEARCSAPCPVSMTQHAYFNLDGGGDVLGHRLALRATRYLPVGADLIPRGDAVPVDGTPLDFRRERRIGDGTLDHCLLLDDAAAQGTVPAAQLRSADGRVAMRLSTDAPALQLYTGGLLAGTPARDGGAYAANAGLALEPQFEPDQPNRAGAAACVLRPGQLFKRTMRLAFDVR